MLTLVIVSYYYCCIETGGSMKQRQINLSQESITNERDLKRLNKGKSIQISRDEVYAKALRNKLASVAKTYGDADILARLNTEVNE